VGLLVTLRVKWRDARAARQRKTLAFSITRIAVAR
jgi:hypothetical protein